ncbi:MAG: GAF domain-containing protein, partial [Anaerolineae bacterium]
LHQFLENVLTAVCDLLRTPTAFVAVIDEDRPQLAAVAGPLEANGKPPSGETLEAIAEGNPPRYLRRQGDFFAWDSYWLLPLRARSDGAVTGVLGVTARATVPDLSEEEEEGLTTLVTQVEAALEDRRIQQSLFTALQHIMPQIEDIQRRRSLLRYEGDPALESLTDLLGDPNFARWVRDALSHYWGGPNLTHSPLLSLQVVEQASEEHGSMVNGLRAVLQKAIERLRPEGDRSMTAAEWLLYNILELKFLRGYKVRDVAMRLAMSESNLYRKQRLAVEEVARVLAEMEHQEQRNEAASSDNSG